LQELLRIARTLVNTTSTTNNVGAFLTGEVREKANSSKGEDAKPTRLTRESATLVGLPKNNSEEQQQCRHFRQDIAAG